MIPFIEANAGIIFGVSMFCLVICLFMAYYGAANPTRIGIYVYERFGGKGYDFISSLIIIPITISMVCLFITFFVMLPC